MSLPTIVEDLTTGNRKYLGVSVTSSLSSSTPASSNPHLIAGFAPQLIIDMDNDLIEGKRYLVKYQDTNLKMCTWETPRALRNFTPLIDNFHQKLKENQIKLGDGRKRFHKALARVRKREEKRKSQESQSAQVRKAPPKKNKISRPKLKNTQSSKESQNKSQDTTTFNPLRTKAQIESQESQHTFAKRVIESQSEQVVKSEEIEMEGVEEQKSKSKELEYEKISLNQRRELMGRRETRREEEREEQTDERRKEVVRRMWRRLDSPEKIQKIWKGEDGRLLVKVSWKQKEEKPRLLATTYGLESYPPEGYKLLMEYLVGKYAKSMRWR